VAAARRRVGAAAERRRAVGAAAERRRAVGAAAGKGITSPLVASPEQSPATQAFIE
jgi:hypothetical protein